jgi:sigma-B regulation protein RsbU (phosphoserine phosphatase)
MSTDVIPEAEAARLAAVRRYDVLDSPPDGAFERITALAARLFDVPIAIVSIVDTDRIWFKSHHGLEADQVDRDAGLCASAILQDGPWLVTDATSDPRTLANPLVAGEVGLQFYAGMPLTTADGHNLGTLCVIDRHPREVTDAQLATLQDLASLVMDELELRLSAHKAIDLEADLRRTAEDVASILQAGLLPPELPAVAGLDLAARYHVADRDQVGGDFYDVIPSGAGCAVVVGDACGKGTAAASLAGIARWTLRTITLRPWTPADALDRLNQVLVQASDHPGRYCTLAVASITPHPAGGADMTLALGGHPHPLLLQGDGSVERVGRTAPIVGWRADAAFTEVCTHLAAGDTLVLFTDGLLEAVAGRGETEDTAVGRILRPLAGRSASQVADGLDAALGSTTTSDDAAFLVVRAR